MNAPRRAMASAQASAPLTSCCRTLLPGSPVRLGCAVTVAPARSRTRLIKPHLPQVLDPKSSYLLSNLSTSASFNSMQLTQLVSIQQQEAIKLDVEAAFAKYRTRLPRLLRGRIGASESVIEEACQVAWLRLVEHASDVHEEAVLGWLLTTAWHAAL